jgi:hypothetical protein
MKNMMQSFRFITQLVVLLAYFKANTTAFTTPSKGCATNGAVRTSVIGGKNGLVLGPIARNGLAFEDIVVGQGRRILPGDTVACYYSGSFKEGPLGKPTVFDQISTFGTVTTSLAESLSNVYTSFVCVSLLFEYFFLFQPLTTDPRSKLSSGKEKLSKVRKK